MNVMDKNETNRHISQQYNVELDDLCSKVLAMGHLVEEQVGNAILAVVSGNIDLAESVISHDYLVNTLEVSTDEMSVQLLARQQPTAKDLRLIVSVIKTITDFERIGDQAVDIARTASHSEEIKWPKNLYSELQRMSNQARTMLHATLQIFSSMDAVAAAELLQRDWEIDADYENIMRQMMGLLMKNPRSISRTLDIIWSARALERIEDHSRNICEHVIYYAEGKDVRHTIIEEMPKNVHGNNVD